MAEKITGPGTHAQPATDAPPATEPKHGIRALHTESTVTVYQAYTPSIGLPAARDGRFPAAWKRDRMTWIKPSFLWMMYRCGWAAKEGQETVLAVEISRSGFDWALRHACLSSYAGRPRRSGLLEAGVEAVPGACAVGPGTRPVAQAAAVPLAAARSLR